MEKEITTLNRLKGGIYGLLIGDALGVPYEFHDATSLPTLRELEFDPPPYFRRSHASILPGTLSDDGAQALVLLDSLITCDGFDIDHFAKGLVDWHDNGFMAVGRNVFDVGMQTRTSILELKSGVPPTIAGGHDEWSNGNGSLMRCLPIALWHHGSDSELIELAFAQSAPTHGHPRSRMCCALYCLWARAILKDYAEPWIWAVNKLYEHFPVDTDQRNELDQKIRPLEPPVGVRGTGYVVNTLHAAHWAVSTESYDSAVKAAVSLGDDTDTTACVTGGIAGLIHGFTGIPDRWVDGLRGKELVEPLVEKLVARVNCLNPTN